MTSNDSTHVPDAGVQRLQPGSRMSQVTVFQGVAYLAGQIPSVSLGEDIETQTDEVLHKIDQLLQAADSDKSRILFCQIFLRDIGDFAGMNRSWDRWVVPGAPPARATVEAGLATGPCRIEIVTTAALGS